MGVIAAETRGVQPHPPLGRSAAHDGANYTREGECNLAWRGAGQADRTAPGRPRIPCLAETPPGYTDPVGWEFPVGKLPHRQDAGWLKLSRRRMRNHSAP